MRIIAKAFDEFHTKTCLRFVNISQPTKRQSFIEIQADEDGYFIQFNSIPFHSIPFNSIQFNSNKFNSIPFNSIPFHSNSNSVQFNSIQSIIWLISIEVLELYWTGAEQATGIEFASARMYGCSDGGSRTDARHRIHSRAQPSRPRPLRQSRSV